MDCWNIFYNTILFYIVSRRNPYYSTSTRGLQSLQEEHDVNRNSQRRQPPKGQLPREKQGTLQWRHNDHDGVSNHQPHGCLLNRLFRRRSKKTSKLRVTGLCVGNPSGPVNSPHKGSVTREMSCCICFRKHRIYNIFYQFSTLTQHKQLKFNSFNYVIILSSYPK